jgi:O-methyltransferase
VTLPAQPTDEPQSGHAVPAPHRAAVLAERVANRLLRAVGYRIARIPPREPADLPPASVRLFREVEPYTMTSPEAVYALEAAVRHVVARGVPGDVVECGVWRGGSMLAVARTLLDLGRTDVDLYLYDTFDGMPPPGEQDVRWTGETAEQLLATERGREADLLRARAGIEEVRAALATVPYPAARVHLVEGKVQDTIPERAPETISVLRLDTDWYDSNRHELRHLYPRLASGGVLILDDYGWWSGVRSAVDEYFAEHPPAPLLVRIDDSGARVAVKP